jgi:hypothetical protein
MVAIYFTSADADPAKAAAGAAACKAKHGIDIYPRTRDEMRSRLWQAPSSSASRE